ncbi:MAG: DMT family transporter [Pseudomonadota bacterium]
MLRAVFLLILATALVPLGDTAGKLLVEGQGIAPEFVAWSRFALGVLLLLPFLGRSWPTRANVSDWRLWLRAALIAGGITSILTALKTEPLANVFGAFFVGPMISVVLSALILKEKVSLGRALLLVAGFAGVLLVVRPGFGMTPGLGFAFLAGVFYGAYLFSGRWLADVAPPRTLLLTQLVGGAILTLPLGVLFWPTISLEVAALVALSAAASAAGNLFLILAYGRASASQLAPFIYFQLIFATIFGRVVFNDIPDTLTFAGLALLIASGFASLALRK